MTDRDFASFKGDPTLEGMEDGRAATDDVGEAACGSVGRLEGVCLPGIGMTLLVVAGDVGPFASIESTWIDWL